MRRDARHRSDKPVAVIGFSQKKAARTRLDWASVVVVGSRPSEGKMSVIEIAKAHWSKHDFPRRYVDTLPTNIQWGKRLFRDTTPATEHIRGNLFHAQARMLSFKLSSADGRESRRRGFRALGAIGPADVVGPVTAKVSSALSQPRADDYVYKGTLATRSLTFVAREVPEVLQLLTPTMLGAVRDYYGSNFRLLNVSAWRNWHLQAMPNSEEAYSNNWHTDGRRIDMLKVFVTASDVTEADGPTHALSREWTREIVKRGFDNRRNYGLPVETIENPKHLVKLTGPAGTALLCNTNLCFHRAGVVGEGRQRDIIEFRFLASPTFSLEMPDDASLAWQDRTLQ
jgi:hypothetical protein